MALYNITDASQIIDIQAINAACNQIDEGAEDFKYASNKVNDAKAYMGGDAMRVDGETMEESFETIANGISNVKKNINDYTNSIRESAQAVYDAQQRELAEYKAAQQNNN